MKRGGPLVRRTPLAPGKPLRRATPARNPLQRQATPAGNATLRRTAPVRKVSARRQQQAAPRRAAEAALAEIFPGCWMCGRLDVEVHGHEILGRAQGGDPTKPDALLCNQHNELCESEPILAAWHGWKRTRKPYPVQPCIAAGDCKPWDHRYPTCERWDYQKDAA